MKLAFRLFVTLVKGSGVCHAVPGLPSRRYHTLKKDSQNGSVTDLYLEIFRGSLNRLIIR